MDSERAKHIMQSNDSIEVLYHGSPVWIEEIQDNNTAKVTELENKRITQVPIYKLVENSPAKT